MRLLKKLFLALENRFARWTSGLAGPRAPLCAALIVPVLFGLLSVFLGQDDNWDLKNYHWYNPYALLQGRLQVDMAPGVWQSYFNPAIDLPYYTMNAVLPPRLVGFVMGFLHGLNFVFLFLIARQLLGSEPKRQRLALLLALVGMCGAGFLSELGNTMGDDLTAPLVLAAVYLVLRAWPQLQAAPARTLGLFLLAGLAMGVGSGLKLTNATYALALGVALLALPVSPGRRLGLAGTYVGGVVAGLALSAGWWWMTMWKTFGNPLFPQFNNIFRSPLALELGVIDHFHMPHNVLEALFWPFVFTAQFTRVSEVVLKQAIIPVLYLAALVFFVVWLVERIRGRQAQARLSAQARFLLVFGLVAYLAWMKLFGIYRYLVPLELLAPLMLWLLVERMAARAHAARIGGWILAATTLAVFPFMTWGHASWGQTAFSAGFPAFARPASTIVFTAHAHPPMGWLATFVPPEVSVISIGTGFPESTAYLARIQAAIASRPGPHYVMLAGAKNEKESGLRRKLAAVDALGMTQDADHCARLDRWLHKVRFQVQVKNAAEAGRACTLELQPQYVVDLAAQDQASLAAAQNTLTRYGLRMDATGCRRYPAAVGAEPYPFMLCPVH